MLKTILIIIINVKNSCAVYIFVEIVYALFSWFFGFRISKEHNLYKIEMFWIKFKLFTVTIDNFKASLLNKSIDFFKMLFISWVVSHAVLQEQTLRYLQKFRGHLKRDVRREIKNRLNEMKSRVRHCYRETDRAGVGWLGLDHRQRGCWR